MLDPSRDLPPSSTSSHQLLIPSMHSGLIHTSLILRHTHQLWGGPVSFMVKFTGAQAKSFDTLGPSTLHRLLKLSLSAASYSITPSTLIDRLWSLICGSFIIIIIIYSGKRKGHLWMIPRAIIKCLNTWHKLVGPISGQGCHFIFRAFFILYISHLLPLFLLFHHYWS